MCKKYFYEGNSEENLIRLEGFVKQFLFNNKLEESNLEYYNKDSLFYIICEEHVKTELENWLVNIGKDYGFRETYR